MENGHGYENANQVTDTPRKKVILIGVSGASCSGKTTLAKHLRSVLKDSFIVHQDDFAPPEELVPVHPVHNVQDWDDPEGAIEWPRLAAFLRRVKEDGGLPADHKSHDGMNKQIPIPVLEGVKEEWRKKLLDIQEQEKSRSGVEIVWGLVDGFLLYWHPDVVRELEVRLFLRVSYAELKSRRERRFGYHTAVQFSPEGSFWQDPPGYWDDIVWPAYLKAHNRIFVDGSVSRGEPVATGETSAVAAASPINGATLDETKAKDPSPQDIKVNGLSEKEDECGQPVSGLLVLQAEEMDMTTLFALTCSAIAEASIVL